jgi:hypothetical protein
MAIGSPGVAVVDKVVICPIPKVPAPVLRINRRGGGDSNVRLTIPIKITGENRHGWSAERQNRPGGKRAGAIAEKDIHLVRGMIGNGQIGVAVGVEIGGRDRIWRSAGNETDAGGERNRRHIKQRSTLKNFADGPDNSILFQCFSHNDWLPTQLQTTQRSSKLHL